MLTLTTVDRISLPTASDFCELETGLKFMFKFFTDLGSHHSWLCYDLFLLFYLNPIRTSLISLLVSVGIAFRRAYRPIEDPRGIENENWNFSVNKKKDFNPLPECRQILAAGTGSSSTGKPQCCAATDYPRAGWKKSYIKIQTRMILYLLLWWYLWRVCTSWRWKRPEGRKRRQVFCSHSMGSALAKELQII